jgi:hypothetical protein
LRAARDPDAPPWLGVTPAIRREHRPQQEPGQGEPAPAGHVIGGRLAARPGSAGTEQNLSNDQGAPAN